MTIINNLPTCERVVSKQQGMTSLQLYMFQHQLTIEILQYTHVFTSTIILCRHIVISAF